MGASDQSVDIALNISEACPKSAARKNRAASGDNSPRKQRDGPTGTDRAIKYSPSVASSPPRSWGGRRNSADRTSESLSLNQAKNILEAAQFAAGAGMPFNRHVTIHWQQAGIADELAARATGRFLKLAGDWIAYRGGRFAWAWVRENDAVGQIRAGARNAKGSHVHILVHIPAGCEIGRMSRCWLRSITGRPYRAHTIKTQRIGGLARAAETAPALYRANLGAVVGYVLKGVSRTSAQELGLDRLEPGGRIIGKRAATSQNIGWAARAAIE